MHLLLTSTFSVFFSFPALSVIFSRWASNTFSIRGGKPFWVDPFDQSVQHIFIDDNIRQNDEDTIVHPKVSFILHNYKKQEKSLIVHLGM